MKGNEMKTRVQITILINKDFELEDFLEEGEHFDDGNDFDPDDEDVSMVTRSDIIERIRDQIDDGDMAFEDLIDGANDYTITAAEAQDQ